MELQLSQIKPPIFRLREQLGNMEELKKSIKSIGLLSPIIVRAKGESFEVVAGHRRYMACIELGMKTIEANVLDVNDKEAFLVALSENIHRKSMDALEEAKAFNDFTSVRGWGSISELAKQLQTDEGYIRHRVELLGLPEETKVHIQTGALSPSHGSELSRLDAEKAEALTEKIVSLGLDRDTTRKAVDLVKRGFSPDQAIQRVIEFPDLEVPKENKNRNALDIAREHIEVSLSRALNFVDLNLEEFPDGEEKAKYIHEIRYPLHSLVDSAIKLRKHGK